MKVVFVTGESFLDHSWTIAKELRKHIGLKIFFLGKEKSEEVSRWCSFFDAVFFERKRYRNPFGLFSELKLIRLIRKESADIVWFDGISAIQIILAKLFLKKYLVTIHDVELHPKSKDFHAKITTKVLYLLAKKNVAVASETQASLFKSRTGLEPKIFQLPIIDYYIDAASETIPDNSKRDKVKFFFFGSIEPYKGIEALIDASRILESRGLSFELNIYGRLKYKTEELTGKIAEIKSARFFNEYIDYKEIHKLYSENDVLVLPYIQVTQCGPLFLAYSENKPVIANRLKGFTEYVPDNLAGFIFDGSAESLAEKMETFIKYPKHIAEMSTYIQNEVNKKFSMPALSEKYLINLKS